jgi:hypothetical protein
MMFSAFQCDSITVPACDKHNTQKSIGDRAIVTAIASGAYQLWKHKPTSPSLTPNVVKAIKALEMDFHQAENEVRLRNFLINPPPDLDVQWPYIRPGVDVGGWVRQLTAALVWSAVGKHDPSTTWSETWIWSPSFITSTKPIKPDEAVSIFYRNQDVEAELNALPWRQGWSSRPRPYPEDIYSFEVALKTQSESDNTEVAFRHRFYNNTSVWYALFPASPEVRSCLLKATSRKSPIAMARYSRCIDSSLRSS